MRQAIQHRSGQALTAQHLRPLVERQVRRHNHTRIFVRAAYDIKEQLTPQLARRNITQLVQDQDVQ